MILEFNTSRGFRVESVKALANRAILCGSETDRKIAKAETKVLKVEAKIEATRKIYLAALVEVERYGVSVSGADTI